MKHGKGMASTKYTSVVTSAGGTEDDTLLDDSVIEMDIEERHPENIGSKLHTAVVHKDFESCKKLMTPENVNCKYEVNTSLLHILVKKYSKRKAETHKILLLLLQKGAKVYVKDKDGNTPLHIAAREGHEELCKILIESQKNTNLQTMVDLLNVKKMTPLHLAAQQGQTKVIEFLLEEGANATLPDKIHYLPLHYAVEKGYPECCKLLRHTYPKDASKDHFPPTPLMLAANGGHEWCCQTMELSQKDLDYQDKQGNTALHRASKKGFEKFVAELISKGADLNIRNKEGNTPVMEAISKTSSGCLTCLMKHGAKLNLENKHKKRVLHIAADKKADECLSLLLEHEEVKQDIDKKDSIGCTPLLIAIKKNCDKSSLKLLDAGASPRAECEGKFTPLHLATENTTTNILQKLLKVKDLNISPTDKMLEQTPLHLAAKNGSRDACVRLLKRGARLTAIDKLSRTSLHESAYYGHSAVVKLLVKKGAKTRALDDKKSTALHAAAAKGHLECCKALADADKQLCMIKDGRGRYTFDVAFNKGQHEVFEFLLNILPFKSANKLPPDMAKNLHAHMHKALRERCRSRIEMIVKSRWWEAGFSVGFIMIHENRTCDNFREIIRQHPDLAKIVMDKSMTAVSPANKSYLYNFKIFEDNYYISAEKENSPTRNDKSASAQQEKEKSPTRNDNSASAQQEKENSPTRNDKSASAQQEKEARDPFSSETGKLKTDAKEFISDPVQWKRDHPVHIMAKSKSLNLLKHPLTEGWLSYKWNTYIKKIYCLLFGMQLIFASSLIFFLESVPNWKGISMKYNVSQEAACQKIQEVDYTNALAGHLVLLFPTVLVFLVEVRNVFKLKRDYRHDRTNVLRLLSAILAFVVLVPYPSCKPYPSWKLLIKPVYAWQCGIISFMLSCICVISTINKLPSYAIFANITHKFIKSYLKGLLLISVIVLTFAFIFHLLLLQDHTGFESLPYVIVKIVVWVLGDLAYDDSFGSKTLSYPIMTNIFFLIFICMVGAFIVTLVKAPSTDPKELAFYKAEAHAHYQLMIDICYPWLRRKHALVKYSHKNTKSWIIVKLEELYRTKVHGFIGKGLYSLTPNVTMMELPDKRQPWPVQLIEKMTKILNLNIDDDDDFTFPDEMNNKLDKQDLKLDQLLIICKQLISNYQSQNEQIIELKHGYQLQNEQIAELKHKLDETVAVKK